MPRAACARNEVDGYEDTGENKKFLVLARSPDLARDLTEGLQLSSSKWNRRYPLLSQGLQTRKGFDRRSPFILVQMERLVYHQFPR